MPTMAAKASPAHHSVFEAPTSTGLLLAVTAAATVLVAVVVTTLL